MPDIFFGGLDFGTSGARISIINRHKELIYSKSVPYQYSFENPNSWIESCSKLLDSLPIKIKSYIDKLAISGTSGTLTACNINGVPLGNAIPYNQACNEHNILLESLTSGEEHFTNPIQ